MSSIANVLLSDTQNVIRSTVRGVISLGGHSVAALLLFQTPPGQPVEAPEWLTGIFALVITWYFATRERGGREEQMPRWQSTARTFVRSVHAIGGGVVLAVLFLKGVEIPNWWVGIYVSILTFYFIELRDMPQEMSSSENP